MEGCGNARDVDGSCGAGDGREDRGEEAEAFVLVDVGFEDETGAAVGEKEGQSRVKGSERVASAP